MSEHRVSMLGASWRRFEDPTRSRDPRVRAVLATLATVSAPAPRAEFHAELRAQLVAIAPRIIAESAGPAPVVDIVAKSAPTPRVARSAARAPHHADSFVARLRRVSIGRPLAIAASVLTAFALLLGGAVYMSKKALPGDSLYGLKRASESLQLATAGSDTERAHDYLDFATTRATEVRDLLSRATASAAGSGPQAGGIDSTTAGRIRSTLASADSDVKSATSLLGKQAIRTKSGSPLDAITAWAPNQLSRLNGIASAMPDGSLKDRTLTSANLVTAAAARAETLAPMAGCSCLGSAGSDDLGPLPCTACSPVTLPTGPAGPPIGATRTTSPGQPVVTPAVPGPNATNTVPDPAQSSSAAGSQSPTSGLHLPLPSLPNLPTPTLPVSVQSCGLSATLGPISIGIGLCPISIKISHHP